MWQVRVSKKCQKQLEKLDPQIARQVIEDMDCLKEDPMQSDVSEDSRTRKLGLRYIRVARDWRLFFRLQHKEVLVEFVVHRETGHEEIARYLRSLNL